MTNFLDVFELELRNQAAIVLAADTRGKDKTAFSVRYGLLTDLADIVRATKSQLNEQS